MNEADLRKTANLLLTQTQQSTETKIQKRKNAMRIQQQREHARL